MKRIAAVVATLGSLSLLLGSLAFVPPAHAADNHDQLINYFRKKSNLGPNTPVSVTDIKSSPIKGAKEGTIQIGNPPQVKKMPFVMSDDGRYVVFGDIEDLTVDPFKSVMEKIDLKNEHAKGPANAKVTIVEYSDFECPFCSRGYDTIENHVLKDYGDKVRFVYKQFPLSFHPWAQAAAISAKCAGVQNADAYWKLYNYYFQHQKEINPQNLKEKTDEVLKGAKIDKKKFDTCVDNKETLDAIKADIAEGQSVGVTGTPGFIVNGRLVSGAQPYEVFKNIIDSELASK